MSGEPVGHGKPNEPEYATCPPPLEVRLGTPCLPLSLSGESVGCVGWWRVRSGVEPRPFRAAAGPAALYTAWPILSSLSNFSLSMGVGRGSLGSLEMIETTITLSLPWEAWGREASILGVTVAGSPFWGRGARAAGSSGVRTEWRLSKFGFGSGFGRQSRM